MSGGASFFAVFSATPKDGKHRRAKRKERNIVEVRLPARFTRSTIVGEEKRVKEIGPSRSSQNAALTTSNHPSAEWRILSTLDRRPMRLL
jgi:hypothetical protein